MTEPIPVSLAIRAVERAIRECDAATPGLCVLARAGFRASLEFLSWKLNTYSSDLILGHAPWDAQGTAMQAAVAPLIAHYDATAPGWRAR